MFNKPHDNLLFDGDPSRADALMAWCVKDIQAREGLGIQVGVGKWSAHMGHNGRWRMKGVLGSVLGLAMLEIAAVAAGAPLPLWSLILAGPAAANAARSMDGLLSPWSRAREDGKSALSSFGALCSGAALSLRAHVKMNLISIPLGAIVTAGVVTKGVSKLFFHNEAQVAAGQTNATMGEKIMGIADAIHDGRWRAGELRRLDLMDQVVAKKSRKDIATEFYRRLAMAHLRHRLLLDPMTSQVSLDKIEQALGPEFAKVRARLAPMVSSAPCSPEFTERVLNLLDSTGTEPWWSPAPGMPSIAEVAQVLRNFQKLKGSPDGALDLRISGLFAACEGHEIRSGLGSSVGGAKRKGGRI